MGFGSTAKKVQKLANLAEKTYKRLNELREQVQEVRSTVDETGTRVERLESEVREQRAILDAVARELDVDPDGIVDELESDATDSSPETEDAAATED